MSPIQSLFDPVAVRSLVRDCLQLLHTQEHLTLSFQGERSQFIRWSQGKVRQTGLVDDASVEMTFVSDQHGKRTSQQTLVQLSGEKRIDLDRLASALASMRKEASDLPHDSFATLPKNQGNSEQITQPALLAEENATTELARHMAGIDLAGIYASGPVMRAIANSAGQFSWFSTRTFSFDYSLYDEQQRAVKSTFTGETWSDEAFEKDIHRAQQQLKKMALPQASIGPGEHRVYLAPDAVAELLGTVSWGGFSEAAFRQGQSGLKRLREGASLSRLLTIEEDFSRGLVPRFSPEGDIAPEKLTLIDKGELKNTLVSSRTSAEYSISSNGAALGETPRALRIATGDLAEEQVLARLGTGLYLNHLHYLNWSDRNSNRITGLTRFACFQVRDGEIVGTMPTLRWDDQVERMLGSELEALTTFSKGAPSVGTYGQRSIGVTATPGALLRSMRFTL